MQILLIGNNVYFKETKLLVFANHYVQNKEKYKILRRCQMYDKLETRIQRSKLSTQMTHI